LLVKRRLQNQHCVDAASSATSEVATAKAEAEAVRGKLAAAKRDAEATKTSKWCPSVFGQYVQPLLGGGGWDG
jgi:hypothetical protein